MGSKAANRTWQVALALVALAGVAWFALGLRIHFGYYADDRQAALRAEALVVQRFNAQAFDAIYDDAADAMRATVSRAQAVDAMRATLKAYGTIVEDNEGATTCFPDQVRMVRWLRSSNGTDLTQVSLWSTPGGDAKLVMMRISPGRVSVDPEIVHRNRCGAR
ncbi:MULTISPECIES: hypothetical protein [Burkholderia]|uniref:hypothetical protein n=1 Tax=Burkholderia TaxID=32008 RepID=UPI000F59B5B6|nr:MULTISPECIES: hypothetical protein [Burkholderia]MBN3742330.1 hypothetical protein [Burkholderia sp. Tr-20355]RQS67555.1 hypothetical protein DF032_35325 [Burkholderia seminalis]